MSELYRRSYEVTDLTRRFPPDWQNANKGLVFSIACPDGDCGGGALEVTRWNELALPSTPASATVDVERINGGFRYVPLGKPAFVWTLNFADPEVFGYHAGPLFAQDEIQVTEHPALASVRSALLSEGLRARTVDEGRPTPILVRNVPRCCFVRTRPSAAAPFGLYGNEFSDASGDAIRSATVRLDPPTRSNILAIAAPPAHEGLYWPQQIESALVTAYSGFRAARLEATRVEPEASVEIHTGFWGCGAFGGNPVLMSIVQILAAKFAGVEQIVFHVFESMQSAALDQATTIEKGIDLLHAIDELHEMRFQWGISDGN